MADHRRLTRKYALGTIGALGMQGIPRACMPAPAYTLRMGIAEAATSVFGRASIHFASGVQRRSNGQLQVEVYPNGQLVAQKDIVGALQSGVVDAVLTSSSLMVPLVPRCQAFDMPFLFKNFDAAAKVLGGPIGDDLFAELDTKGITGLAWGISGFRLFETTTKPIVKPEDMKGLRMRIITGAIFASTYLALGAIPVVIDASEVFTALGQHTVDGLDFPITSFTTAKLYTAVKHVANSSHNLSVEPLLGSKRKIDALPAPLQKIVREEAKAMLPYWRGLTMAENSSCVETLKSNGVAFTDIQYSAFRKAVEPVYATYQSRIGDDLLDRISRVNG